jgi:GDPmannose 4,6-dehydratase
VLSAILQKAPECRFYFAASSEMFGKAKETPQNEYTPFNPRSPYGISKVAGYHLTKNYREAYGLHATNGILFNHESPRRGLEFVTRKITSQAAKIKLGLENKIKLGNLDAKRDWGHAKDFIEGMWLMLQQKKPGDYVLGTGNCHSVREFLEIAFGYLDLDPYRYLEIDEEFFRPAEIVLLQADASNAKKVLKWTPKTSFETLIQEMIEKDLELYSSVKAGIDIKNSGNNLV